MKNMHKRSIVGIYEDDAGLVPVNVHFSEWWNGEGMMFDFDDRQRFDLHSDELQALCVIAIATGMIDIDVCKGEAELLVEDSIRREAVINAIAKRNAS